MSHCTIVGSITVLHHSHHGVDDQKSKLPASRNKVKVPGCWIKHTSTGRFILPYRP